METILSIEKNVWLKWDSNLSPLIKKKLCKIIDSLQPLLNQYERAIIFFIKGITPGTHTVNIQLVISMFMIVYLESIKRV